MAFTVKDLIKAKNYCKAAEDAIPSKGIGYFNGDLVPYVINRKNVISKRQLEERVNHHGKD